MKVGHIFKCIYIMHFKLQFTKKKRTSGRKVCMDVSDIVQVVTNVHEILGGGGGTNSQEFF